MRKYPLEKQIQKACLDYLKLQGIFAYKINNVGIFKQATNSYIPAQTKGIPDVIAHWPLNTITYLEIKSKTGYQSQAQTEFQEQCIDNGVNYYVIRSLDDLMDIINA